MEEEEKKVNTEMSVHSIVQALLVERDCSNKLFGFFTIGVTGKWAGTQKTHLQPQLPENKDLPPSAFPHTSGKDNFFFFFHSAIFTHKEMFLKTNKKVSPNVQTIASFSSSFCFISIINTIYMIT